MYNPHFQHYRKNNNQPSIQPYYQPKPMHSPYHSMKPSPNHSNKPIFRPFSSKTLQKEGRFPNKEKENDLPTLKSPSLLKKVFFDEQGQIDLSQAVKTVDQVARVVGEITPIVQQVSHFFTKK
ncbi:YppG family protein [Alkalihalobacillus trypoxylicola]|uniref:Uncharacterized protein n=1 Tax=Alkalihalobacillus trypoxylicola TaxID=519424 RepID=A0A162F659_9BACI|nr:YppG family protein [Alkalihalobacillus trypoxylicola]KYG34870.1 hypothetical protein AZF04_00620 [Alkalihalobacillus trypoxylicola]